jgi:hypothetical protein
MSDESRVLVHVERIESVTEIPKADKIEVVQVLGWQCVAKKGDFKVGDKCIYIEIDSIVPEWPMFEFLRPYKFRVRTIKLRGQVSQGLCLPINRELLASAENWKGWHGQGLEETYLHLGMDLTEAFKVRKYDPQGDRDAISANNVPHKNRWAITSKLMRFAWFRWFYFIFNKGKEKFPWPQWISHTDETRIQNDPELYLSTKDTCYCSEKLDGQSCTIFITKGKRFWNKPIYGVCSRNVRLAPGSAGSWPKIHERYKAQMHQAFLEFPEGFAIQGEIIGPAIQQNKYQRKDYEFYVFNVIQLNGRKLAFHSLEDFCRRFGFIMVPVLERAFKVNHTLPEILKYAEGNSVLSGVTTRREGVVIRSWDQSVSFKVINNDFLLNERVEEEDEQQNKPAKEVN